jgi:two-component system sensor histidine kinase VicK
VKLSIRLQLLLGFLALLVLGGGSATLLLSRWLASSLTQEVIRRAEDLAESLATWSEEAVLTENRIEMMRLVEDTKASNPDVAYVFIQDPRRRVTAHSFQNGFPEDLRRVTESRDMTLLQTEMGPVRDISAPILEGRGGRVHLGYSERGIQISVRRLRMVIWLITVGIFAAGAVAILALSGFLTRPIAGLTSAVHRFGSGDLGARVPGPQHGEIGTLAAAFNTMAGNLERQAGQLRYLTEYNQNLIDNLGVGVYVLDRDLRVQYANRELVEEVGEVKGRLCHDVICRQSEPCMACVAVRTREHGTVQRQTCHLPDGRYVEQTAMPVHDVDGSIATVVTRRDITEDVRLREQVTQHEKLAAVGELAAVVAHEVNNPLDGMHSLIRLVLDGPEVPEETRGHLGMVDDGLSRLEMIVRRLLTFTADEAEPSLVSTIDEQLERALAFVGRRLEISGVEVRLRLEGDRVPIRVDPNRFPQVLVNLLLNAADAMPEGGRLTISARSEDGGVCIAFEDEGPGVPPGLQEQIFRPFFTTKGPGKGTGLGLAVSRRIIEGHGGTLSVREAERGGARFEVRLRSEPDKESQ